MIFAQMGETSYNIDMPHERILVVDDDREITRLLRSYLEQAGYAVLTAHSGETALHTLRREHPDLLVLDLMLPDRDGWDVTRLIRADASLADTPIIMLTARVDDTEKILGLELGADDYITKPFNPREVLARVRAMLRRQQRMSEQGSATTILQVGQLRLDVARHDVTLNGTLLDLTRTEFSLLQTLMQNPGYVFTRSELIEKALGHSYESIERSLDTHIKNLRRKVGDDPKEPLYLQTVYGVGYRMAGPP
ncbi:MAG: response regulator transcription factor [Caldilineaceae bacterium]|nr:response regulator transcription factor [Caldilineaceae bacterium]